MTEKASEKRAVWQGVARLTAPGENRGEPGWSWRSGGPEPGSQPEGGLGHPSLAKEYHER